MLATVDVIPQEQIVGFGRIEAVLEQSNQVVVLAVDVACISMVCYHRSSEERIARGEWVAGRRSRGSSSKALESPSR